MLSTTDKYCPYLHFSHEDGTVYFFKTLVFTYKSPRHYTSEDHHLTCLFYLRINRPLFSWDIRTAFQTILYSTVHYILFVMSILRIARYQRYMKYGRLSEVIHKSRNITTAGHILRENMHHHYKTVPLK